MGVTQKETAQGDAGAVGNPGVRKRKGGVGVGRLKADPSMEERGHRK